MKSRKCSSGSSDRPKVVVISGATASGKSAFSVNLALSFGGEIINADSMQVYRGMDIGTAKPSASERRGIPHHLLDVVAPDEEFNAAIFRSMALPVVRQIQARGKVCFVVGGTGLYIKTLIGGLIPCASSDSQLRISLEQEYEDRGFEYFYEKLQEMDRPTAASLHPHDKVRLIRAAEIMLLTGRRLSDLRETHNFRERHLDAITFCLNLDRERLYERVNARALAMFDAGLVEETARLLQEGYSPDLKPMKAIGYRHVIRHLKGEWSLEETIERLQRDTRRYAKRQLTWFRANPEVVWLEPTGMSRAMEAIRVFLEESA